MKKISVDLNGIDEIFQEPEFDPFDPDCRCESGIADLFNQTQNLSTKDAVQIELTLPGESAEPAIQEKIETAIERYCEVKIIHSEREIRHQGMRDMSWVSDPAVGCFFHYPDDLPARNPYLSSFHWCWNYRLGDALATSGQHTIRVESLPANKITLSAAQISTGGINISRFQC